MKDRQRRLFLVICALLGMLVLTFAGCKKKPQDEQPELPDSGEEAGTYYFDSDSGDEYLITLGGKSTYTLTVGSSSEDGTYTLDGSSMTLKKDDTTRTATYEGNVLILDYDGAQLRFLKKVNYTVAFDAVGGSTVESVSVLNGKSPSAPALPTRDGYVFIGWYSDEAYKTPFVFGATPVTSDVTLRARWAEKPADSQEYRISYNLGYDGGTTPADAETIGGKLYGAAVPAEREGYRFVGWWISTANEGSKLSYRFEEGSESGGTVFTADTTLFAVWQRADATFASPAVSVSDTAVTWDSVGSAAYLVKITAPDGSVLVDGQRTTTTVFQVRFEMAGNYRVEVTAVDAGGNVVSETAVRVYTNKALNRVGGFTVVDSSVLVFRGVAGAEKYLVTVDCGNAGHRHEAFDNGSALYFNFANCEMKPGGITFTVTAVANGRASSTATFTYEKNLSAATGLKVTDDVLSWNPVPGATSYLVTVGDETYTVLGNSFPLTAFADADYSIGVTPVAHGSNSPAAATVDYAKKSPALPEQIRLVGTVLSWDAVPGATSYEVRLGDKTLKAEAGKTEIDLADAAAFAEGADYALTLKVIGANGSAEKTLTVRYNAMDPLLTYREGILRWTPVVGAVTYEVQFNGVTVAKIENGDSFLQVNSFTQSGENTVRVRFSNGVYDSEWAELTVTAHKVTLDGRGGSTVESLYKAVGDPITLPTPTKSGYDFSAWYNLPGGAESNGRRYADAFFVESGETVLYAYYTPKAYTVHYNTGDGNEGTETVYFGRDYRLMVPTSSSGTRAFGGWFSAPYGAGIAFTDAEGNSLNAWNYVDDNVTAYAFWVDSVLRYEKIGNAYAVSKGARIDLVSSVTVPATYNGLPVTEIIGGAFENCETLTEIRLPDTLTRIAADTAFAGCEQLKSITVYASNDESNKVKYSRYSSADGVLFDGGDSSAPHAPRPVLMPMAKTGSYTVPSGVDMIPRSAFAGSKLSKIVLPVSVTEIGTEAFANCENLVSVVFAEAGATNGVKGLAIGDRAFLNCTGLTVIALPARLQSISLTAYAVVNGEMVFENTPSAFEGCENLADVVVAKGTGAEFTSVDGVLFGEKGVSLVYFPEAKSADGYEIPAGVTKIGDSAFRTASGVKTLVLPGRVTYIGNAAFATRSRLTSVTFGAGIGDVEIGDYAFYGTGITEIVFEAESRVTKIGVGAFKKSASFSDTGKDKTLVIPSTVTSIGDEAFAGFGKVDVTISESEKTLTFGNRVFYDCTVGTLKLPKNVKALTNFFSGMSVASIVVDKDNALFMSDENGVLYSKTAEGTPGTLLLYPSGKTEETFTVPSGVTAIAGGAFRGNKSLKTVSLPASVSSVGNEAFRECTSLAVVTFGQTEGKLEIGEYAFYGLNLTALELPKNAAVSVGAYAFAENSKVTVFGIGGVVTVGDHAFESLGSSATGGVALVVPASLTDIGNYAFRDAKINAVSFEGTPTLRTIGAYAFSGAEFPSFTVPASVESVAAYAFANNSTLTELLFEDGTTDLVLGTAYGEEVGNILYNYVYGSDEPTGVTTLALPGRLTKIEKETFYGLKALASVTFGSAEHPSRLTTICEGAFSRTGLKTVTVPKSVQNTADTLAIGKDAFSHASLASVNFEAGGTAPLTIGENAFNGNSNLTTVTLPARLASFTDANGNVTAPFADGKTAFGASLESVEISGEGKCEYATENGMVFNADKTELIFCPQAKSGSVVIPASVKKIAAFAFNNCQKVTAVTFAAGSNCEEIGYWAFRFVAFSELVLPDTVSTIGEGAFMSCAKLTSFTLPAALGSFDASIVDSCQALQKLNVSAQNKQYQSIDGVLFSKDGKTLIYYLPTRTDTSYTVPEGTETFADGAFNQNRALESVTLPASLKLVGKNAFYLCRALKSVTFTEGGTEALVIGYQAFCYTPSLTAVRIPARTVAIDDFAFSNSALASLTFEDNSKLSAIGNSAFYGTKLKSLALPTSLREIGDGAFANCGYLVAATLPEGLITVGKEVFKESYQLVSVSLPSTLQTLETCAFEGCYNLKNVSFAKNSVIKVLYVGTFQGCTGLEAIELPASLTKIPNRGEGDNLFGDDYKGLFCGCSALKRVTFEEGSKLTKIGNYAFYETALESIVIPSSVESIGEHAFESTKLTSLTIPATVTSLGTQAFYWCENLLSVTLGSGIKTLPTGVFGNCSALTAFTVPATVTSIASDAFSGCDSIDGFKVDSASLSFRERDGVVYDLDWNIVLFPSSKTTYTIPAGTKKLPEKFFTDYTFESIDIEEGNTSFVFDASGVLYDADMTTLLYFPETVETYVIPATLPSSMSPDAFFELLAKRKGGALTTVTVSPDNKDCRSFFDDGVIYYNHAEYGWVLAWIPSGLTELKIPKEVSLLTCIGEEGPFNGSALTTVTFEAGRTKSLAVGPYIFYGAKKLVSIVLPDNTVSIGNYAFYNCTGLKELVLPETVTEIGSRAFQGCKNLAKLVIPASVTAIGNQAFRNWQASQTIYVSFAEDAVPNTFNSYWKYNCSATIVYDYKGEQSNK